MHVQIKHTGLILLIIFGVIFLLGNLMKGYAHSQATMELYTMQRYSQCAQKQLSAEDAAPVNVLVHSSPNSQTRQDSKAVAPGSCNSSLHFIAEPASNMCPLERPNTLPTGQPSQLSSQLFIFSEPDPPRSV